MVGVDKQTKGGMWTVVENYLHAEDFLQQVELDYVPTSTTGSIAKRLRFTAAALVRIIANFLRWKYDIVHVHMSERGSVYRKNIVISLAKLCSAKVIIHMHGVEFETWYRGLDEAKQQGVRRILDKGDKILILGSYWLDFVQGLVEAPDRVTVLHNAVYVPEKNYYDLNSRQMLFLGVVGQRKGVFDLLEAVKRIDAELPADVKLMIYGPENNCSIREKINAMELSHRVEYGGWLSAGQKAEVFSQTAVNILPSYNEGLPMTILETMAYGIPNISTSVAAIPEAVNETNGAVICAGDVEELGRQILGIMKDTAARAEKSSHAYKMAKDVFSVRYHVQQLLEVYRELKHS